MTLHYCVSKDSSKPVLLCLHGFLGSLEDWNLILPFLEPYFSILRVDLPGHGQSDISEMMSLDSLCLALKTMLDALSVSSVYILGYSMGGRVALVFNSLYPEYVQGLILESAHPGMISLEDRETRLQADLVLAAHIRSSTRDSFLREWYAQALFYPLDVSTLLPHRQALDLHAVATALSCFSLGKQSPIRVFHPFTLFIYGAYDQKYKLLAPLFPRAYGIEGAGHNTHFMFPARFATLVLSILKGEMKQC